MKNTEDLRFIRTNQLLFQSFSKLLTAKNFDSITVNDICENAMVRRATFYTHFVDKYDFFACFIHSKQNDFLADLDRTDQAPDMEEVLSYMFGQLVTYIRQNEPLVLHARDSRAFPILLDILTDTIRDSIFHMYMQCCSDTTDTVFIHAAAAFLSGGTIQLLRGWVMKNMTAPEDDLKDQYAAILRCFFGVRKAEA